MTTVPDCASPSTYLSMKPFAEHAEGTDGDERLENATWAWIRSLTDEERDAFIFPLARSHMATIMRGRTRQAERKVSREVWTRGPRSEALTSYEARLQLLGHTAFVPGEGRRVEILQLTAAQCVAKAEYHERLARGNAETARFYRDCAALIRAKSVNCLADLDALPSELDARIGEIAS